MVVYRWGKRRERVWDVLAELRRAREREEEERVRRKGFGAGGDYRVRRIRWWRARR